MVCLVCLYSSSSLPGVALNALSSPWCSLLPFTISIVAVWGFPPSDFPSPGLFDAVSYLLRSWIVFLFRVLGEVRPVLTLDYGLDGAALYLIVSRSPPYLSWAPYSFASGAHKGSISYESSPLSSKFYITANYAFRPSDILDSGTLGCGISSPPDPTGRLVAFDLQYFILMSIYLLCIFNILSIELLFLL